MRSRLLLALLLLSAAHIELHAAGFDDSYEVYQGDLAPSDGLIDLYVRGTGPIPIMLDDLTITVPSAVTDFVLRNNGNGTFGLVSPLTSAQRSAARSWAPSAVDRALRDVDFNGTTDITLQNLGDEISGAFDHTIFAASGRGRSPVHVSPQGTTYQNYYRDLGRWLFNPNYFTNVPLKVVSSQPPTPVWYASSPNADYGVIFGLIARCQQRFPNSVCGYTTIDPTPNSADPNGCTRSVVLLDPKTLDPIGTDTRNVCEQDFHVYVYLPGSVTVLADNSVFDAAAKESADILKDFRNDCASVPQPAADRLGTILTGVYGANLWGAQGSGPANVINSFPHAPFPGDSAFDPADLTFHHYDVVTRVCSINESGCNAPHLESLLRYFSYPSFQLRPQLTQVNYVERPMAFITLLPLGHNSYIVPAGHIKQQFITPPFGTGAVQNVTQSDHLVYPGTISRVIRQSPSWFDVITHGIGINRAFCTMYSPKVPVQVIVGWGNDVFGSQAFKSLDGQMKKLYNSNPTSLPASSSGGFSKPEISQLGQPAVLEIQ